MELNSLVYPATLECPVLRGKSTDAMVYTSVSPRGCQALFEANTTTNSLQKRLEHTLLHRATARPLIRVSRGLISAEIAAAIGSAAHGRPRH